MVPLKSDLEKKCTFVDVLHGWFDSGRVRLIYMFEPWRFIEAEVANIQ